MNRSDDVRNKPYIPSTQGGKVGQTGSRGVDQANPPRPRDTQKVQDSSVLPLKGRELGDPNSLLNLINERANSDLTKKQLLHMEHSTAQVHLNYVANAFRKNVVDYIEEKVSQIPSNHPLREEAEKILLDQHAQYEKHLMRKAPSMTTTLPATKEDEALLQAMEDRYTSEQTKKLVEKIKAQQEAVNILKTNPNDAESRKTLDLELFASLNKKYYDNVLKDLEKNFVKMTPSNVPFHKAREYYSLSESNYKKFNASYLEAKNLPPPSGGYLQGLSDWMYGKS